MVYIPCCVLVVAAITLQIKPWTLPQLNTTFGEYGKEFKLYIIMEKLIQYIKNFEKRNNISIVVQLYGDGSSVVEEFWDEERLHEGKVFEDLITFLRDTQYKLDDIDGRCLSPVQRLE